MRATCQTALLISGLLLISSLSTAANAGEEASPLRIYGRMGLSTGGDRIVNGTYVNTGTDFDIRAGSGTSYAVGIEVQATQALAIQLTTGYQSEKTDATNGEIRFARKPKEAVLLYGVAPQWRVGLGLRQDPDAEVTWRHDTAGSGARKFDADTGKVLEVQYLFSPRDLKSAHSLQAGLSLRLIQQNFHDPLANKNYNGNQVGVHLFAYY